MNKSDNAYDTKQERLSMLQASFKAVLGKEELFSNIIDFFPYPIEVYAQDGTTIMVNHAMLQEFEIASKDMVIGLYNIFKDPEIEKSGLTDIVREAFKGKTIFVPDIKVPVKSIREFYQTGGADIVAMYQDATGFPILNEWGEVSHVVILLITRRIYKGNVSIAKAREYLESNWDQEYNIIETSNAAGLSPYHFSRVFKSDVGITPYNYYIKLKMEHLTEKLRDTNLTMREVFGTCGLAYTGYSFGVFKKHVGVTPLKYREMTIKQSL